MHPLDPLYRVIGWLLAFFYIPSSTASGIAIILLTIVIMVVQFPLTAKQTRSMIQMQRVQPEIKKIQAEVQGRQAEAERGAAEVLPREQDQPAGRVPAADRHDPDRHRGVPHVLARRPDARAAVAGAIQRAVPRDLWHRSTALHHVPRPRTGHPAGALHFLGMNLNWSPARRRQLDGQLHRARCPYYIADRARGRHRLVPGAADPGPPAAGGRTRTAR